MVSPNKVTDYNAVTSVQAADVLYLIRNSTDEKVLIQTLFGTIPVPIKTTERLFLGGTPQTINNGGAIVETTSVTLITNDSISALTIQNGESDGQIKILIFTAGVSNSTISGANLIAPIVLNTVGQTTLLLWQGTHWWVL